MQTAMHGEKKKSNFIYIMLGSKVWIFYEVMVGSTKKMLVYQYLAVKTEKILPKEQRT